MRTISRDLLTGRRFRLRHGTMTSDKWAKRFANGKCTNASIETLITIRNYLLNRKGRPDNLNLPTKHKGKLLGPYV